MVSRGIVNRDYHNPLYEQPFPGIYRRSFVKQDFTIADNGIGIRFKTALKAQFDILGKRIVRIENLHNRRNLGSVRPDTKVKPCPVAFLLFIKAHLR